MSRFVKLLVSFAPIFLIGCSRNVATSDVVGTWNLVVTNPPVEMIVTFRPDFSFEQRITEKGHSPQTVTGMWTLDGNDIWLKNFLWWKGGQWTNDEAYYWEVRTSQKTAKLFAIFGDISPDRDGYVELELKPTAKR